MKRRQIQVGSPFDEAQSILGDPLWLVNYAIQVLLKCFLIILYQTNLSRSQSSLILKQMYQLFPKSRNQHQFKKLTLEKPCFKQQSSFFNKEIDTIKNIFDILFIIIIKEIRCSIQKVEQQGAPIVQQQVFQTQEKTTPQQSQPVTQQSQSNMQQSRAQQLIQQSQQLIQRRRQPKQQDQHQNDVNQNQQQFNTSSHIQQTNSIQQPKNEEIIQQPFIQTIQKQDSQKLKEQQYEQQQQQYQQYEQDFHSQLQFEVPKDQLQVVPPITKVNANQNEKLQQTQTEVQKPRPLVPPRQKEQQKKGQVVEDEFKQQLPQQQQRMLNNSNYQNQSSVIIAQTFYHGLVSYDIQSNQLKKLPYSSIVSQYPGPYFKNRSPDNLRQLRYFWSSFNANNALLQLAIDHLEKPLEKNSALQIIESKLLNDQSGSAFVEAYERIYNQNDWETKLLVSILEGEFINAKQQQSLIEYIKKRSYQDDQEAWLIRLAVLLKMVPIDQEYYSELLIQLQHLYISEQIQARLLWLLLKMEIQNTQVDVFLLSFFTKFNYSLCHSEIQLLIGDSHMCFHNQQNAELYYKLSLLFVESENYDKALECVKFSIDLGYHSKARDLRERILQVIELKEKNKSNTNNNSNSGLLGYFGQAVNAVKNIQKQPQQQQSSYQPQQQNFYYDKQLKAYVINGVPQIAPPEEEQKKEVLVAAPPPPRRKIDPPKPIVYEEQLTQQTQEIAEDPFASQSEAHQSEHNKKKNSLLRNRYVQ